ncbi:nucleotidyltransferase family protein [Sulfurimonas sp.]|uniref:nucleotidyltransferase family protein n=1 Tax=Sulfurimonas sp. TaxID=2022749 RepID=UPI00260E30DD|nr:nucleotidyltransferase family protein [Sulfurimonas sp.]
MNNVNSFKILCSILETAHDTNVIKLKKDIITNTIPWNEVIKIANNTYLIPAVYYSLQEKKLFQYITDQQLCEYLSTIFEFNTQRNIEILNQLLDLNNTLHDLNISPIFLKGSALLCENTYEKIGIRHLTDIDILIEKNKIEIALNELFDHGYSYLNKNTTNNIDINSHHVSPISKEGMPTSVEIHRTVLGESAVKFMPNPQNYTVNCSHPDFINAKIFKPTYIIYHAFLHTELQDENHKYKRLDLRHLYDFVTIVNKYNNEINWKLLHHLTTKINCQEILYDYLYLAKMFFFLDTPLTIENKHTILHYKKVLKGIALENTILEKFYPLSCFIPKLTKAYSRKRLEKIYGFNSNIGYFIATLKYMFFHIKNIKL